jgi:predicted acetyltransferase
MTAKTALVATRALGLLLPIVRARGLPRLLVTCDEDNPASRRVIERNGGVPAGMAPHPHRPGIRKLLFWVGTACHPAGSAPYPWQEAP